MDKCLSNHTGNLHRCHFRQQQKATTRTNPSKNVGIHGACRASAKLRSAFGSHAKDPGPCRKTNFSKGVVKVLDSCQHSAINSPMRSHFTYPRSPSHVDRMVRLNPKIDRMPKFRWRRLSDCERNQRVPVPPSPFLSSLLIACTHLQYGSFPQSLKGNIIRVALREPISGIAMEKRSIFEFVCRHDGRVNRADLETTNQMERGTRRGGNKQDKNNG